MSSKTEMVVSNRSLTRSVSASGILPSATNRTAMKNKDYALNKTKSLDKKSAGCMKEHMKCEIKQGNNVVIEMSTAAYELSKSCLNKLLNDENFPYFAERRDSIEQTGANVDTCYRIYNKKADGNCGKMLKFVINMYHTTSTILVNGNRTDIFLSEIHNELCSKMTACCKELDILNINIASVLEKDHLNRPAINKQITQDSGNKSSPTQPSITQETISTQHDKNIPNETNNDTSLNEVSELCPACLNQAYGKVVQCGECSDWYHYDCLRIDDTTIETLGDNDFICRMCTDNLLHIETSAGSKATSTESNDVIDLGAINVNVTGPNNKITNNNVSANPDISLNELFDESVNSQKITNVYNCSEQQNKKEDSDRSKMKKVTKTQKVKKEEVIDKSYILDLENQIKVLKSTIDLYQKNDSHIKNLQQTPTLDTVQPELPQVAKENDSCRHKCCNDIYEKLQENRIRMLETQMMQNMYIQNAMHIQLLAQTRPFYPAPEPRVPSPYQMFGQPYTATPQQPVPYPLYRHYPVNNPMNNQTPMNMCQPPTMPVQVRAQLSQPQHNGYSYAAMGQQMPETRPFQMTNGLQTGLANPQHQTLTNLIPLNGHQQPQPPIPSASPNNGIQSLPIMGIQRANQVPSGRGTTNQGQLRENSVSRQHHSQQQKTPRNGSRRKDKPQLGPQLERGHLLKPLTPKSPIHVIDLEAQETVSTEEATRHDRGQTADRVTDTSSRKRQHKSDEASESEYPIMEKMPHMSTSVLDKGTKLIEVIVSRETETDNEQNSDQSHNEGASAERPLKAQQTSSSDKGSFLAVPPLKHNPPESIREINVNLTRE